MKTVVIGDIHGRTVWKDILEKEKPDKTVFLGDYVSTHEGISSMQQISNLLEILSTKEKRPEQFILLRGNHDMQHLGYSWAGCSGLDREVFKFMSALEFRQRFLEATQWLYEIVASEKHILFSHAGISRIWLQNCGVQSLSEVNELAPSELFSFTPDSRYDVDGESVTQPCTWIRPTPLKESALPGYTQIIGHTPMFFHDRPIMYKARGSGDKIWLCDALQTKGYLVMEGSVAEPRVL